MTTQEIHSMRDKILEGIALSYSRLVESTIKNDGELVVSVNGKVTHVKAKELKS
jgi:hypothetical protein